MATSPKTGDPELGRKIAARRDELGMSRKQLAEETRPSYPYVAQIETGYRLPSTKNQVVLARGGPGRPHARSPSSSGRAVRPRLRFIRW